MHFSSLPPVLVALSFGAAPADGPGKEFDRDVRPVFERRCLGCHSGGKPKGGLDLTRRANALKGGKDGPALVPGRPGDSPLWQRVAADEMPPRSPLPAAEKAALKKWLDSGASWRAEPLTPPQGAAVGSELWSLKPVRRPVPPPVKPGAWSRNPIDQFVLARLESRGLKPSPESDRRTLIRRLSFDLLGLPPTPEEADAFAADRRTDAYERLVERYLASPHYGERWGRHWLDVVRFAESNGFEMNQPRPNAWPYRDYVIRAFNEDKPYDQFVREQLAGDALGADEATGFLVAGPWDQVKSPDPILTAQQRADELHDLTSNVGATFLGLTVGCARCHDHKFDPVSQTDYYALTAVFAGVQHGERPYRVGDNDRRRRRSADLRRDLGALDANLGPYRPRARLSRVLPLDTSLPVPSGPGARGVEELTPSLDSGSSLVYQSGSGRGELGDAGDLRRLPTLGRGYRRWGATGGADLFAWSPGASGRFRVWVSWGCGDAGLAPDARYVLDRDGNGKTNADQAEIARVDQRRFADGTDPGAGRKLWSGFADAGVHEFRAESRILLRRGKCPGGLTADTVLLEEVPGGTPRDRTTMPHPRPPVSHGANDDRFDPVAARFVRFSVLDSGAAEPCLDELEVFTAGPNPRNVALAAAGSRTTASGTLPGYAIHKLEHLTDGRYGNDFSWISSARGKGWVQVEFPGPQTIDRVVWSRDRSGTSAALRDRLAVGYRIEVSADGSRWQTVADSSDRLPPAYRDVVSEIPTLYGVPDSDWSRLQALVARHGAVMGELRGLTGDPTAYAGRFVQPGPTRRLDRGDPTQPREEVRPGAIAGLGGRLVMKSDTPERERRLALARWLTDAQNPLTARVMVNRIWQHHFGEGLVSTPSDFGNNGARPTHPELLDWLAVEFVARGWKVKDMHRLIVLSNSYRQSGRADPRGLAEDAGSRLLWRYPPRRLEAEPLRDTILAVCGNLDPREGGPGFDLFEPNNNYVRVFTPKGKLGPAEWRRMVYQSKPRMQLDAVFGAFDCPDAGQSAPKRTSSTTPLQALNLLNSPFVMQQAEIFAGRLRRESGDDPAAQATRAFRLAFCRPPGHDESEAAVELIRSEGLTVFCRALLNANEFLYVD